MELCSKTKISAARLLYVNIGWPIATGEDMNKIEKAKVRELYEQGYSPSLIAEKYPGVTRQYIRQVLVAQGCKPECQDRKMTASSVRKDEIKKDFLAGMTVQQIVEKYDMTENFIRRFLKHAEETKEQYATRKCRNIRKEKVKGIRERDAKVREMYESGKSVKELAEIFETSATNIYRILRVGRQKVESQTG